MYRYVILRHETPPDYPRGLHWDLMLEMDETLRTWALEQEPQYDVPIKAEQLPDHRLAYLDYEGTVSGDRGVVSRWTCGNYSIVAESENELTVHLSDGQLPGLVRISRSNAAIDDWTVVFSK